MDNNIKTAKRIRRGAKLRHRVARRGLIRSDLVRLCAYKSSQHTYAQLITADGSKTLASASTLEKGLSDALKGKTSNIQAAELIGETIAERAKKLKLDDVVFDRSGYKYHGRISAIAEAARKKGLKF